MTTRVAGVLGKGDALDVPRMVGSPSDWEGGVMFYPAIRVGVIAAAWLMLSAGVQPHNIKGVPPGVVVTQVSLSGEGTLLIDGRFADLAEARAFIGQHTQPRRFTPQARSAWEDALGRYRELE